MDTGNNETQIVVEQEDEQGSLQSRLKRLRSEIKKQFSKCDKRRKVAIDETTGTVFDSIRLGWLLRDASKEVRSEGTLSFDDWVEANFKGVFTLEEAKRFMKFAKGYLIDAAYVELRASFGLDPLLVEAISDRSLEDQLRDREESQAYVSDLRKTRILPAKANQNGEKELRPEKTEEEKVADLIKRAAKLYRKCSQAASIEDWETLCRNAYNESAELLASAA